MPNSEIDRDKLTRQTCPHPEEYVFVDDGGVARCAYLAYRWPYASHPVKSNHGEEKK